MQNILDEIILTVRSSIGSKIGILVEGFINRPVKNKRIGYERPKDERPNPDPFW